MWRRKRNNTLPSPDSPASVNHKTTAERSLQRGLLGRGLLPLHGLVEQRGELLVRALGRIQFLGSALVGSIVDEVP